MRHDKLVRDKIPAIITSRGETPVTRILGKEEYRTELKSKLNEEVAEFLASNDDPEELADILEVVYALAEDSGTRIDELQKIRLEKAEKRGGFKDRIYLVETI